MSDLFIFQKRMPHIFDKRCYYFCNIDMKNFQIELKMWLDMCEVRKIRNRNDIRQYFRQYLMFLPNGISNAEISINTKFGFYYTEDFHSELRKIKRLLTGVLLELENILSRYYVEVIGFIEEKDRVYENLKEYYKCLPEEIVISQTVISKYINDNEYNKGYKSE